MVEGIDHPKITTKRIKVEEIVEKVEEEDRISGLPDCVLVEILSRLPSTKSAIRTGTLSKRWKYLWTSVSTLIFADDSCPLSDFVSFVDKTLAQCRQSKLRKFAVNTRYDIQFESQVNNWIRYAISCNVEELDLTLWSSAEFLLNEIFSINSCFTDLRLRGCIFNPIGAISWKRLKSLWIYAENLDEDLIKNILSGSPLLETLVLDDSYGYWKLGITSNCIKKLVFDLYCDFDGEVESHVNNWIRYAISCNVEELELWLDNEAKFMFNEDFFIGSCFTDLTLSGCIFNPKGAIGWKKLRSLCIFDGNLDEDVIENILSGSPLLETLKLYNCYGYSLLDITSKSVKKLTFSRYRYQDCDDEFEIADDIIEINAPNILSLNIHGGLLWKLVLLNVSSLVEANLYFTKGGHHETDTQEETEEEMLKGFIRSLRHVKELKIGGYYCKTSLEKYELDRDLNVLTGLSGSCNTCRSYIGSISKEVQQLKEKIQKMEHEQAKREAEMQDKLKAFEQLLLSRFPRPGPPPS